MITTKIQPEISYVLKKVCDLLNLEVTTVENICRRYENLGIIESFINNVEQQILIFLHENKRIFIDDDSKSVRSSLSGNTLSSIVTDDAKSILTQSQNDEEVDSNKVLKVLPTLSNVSLSGDIVYFYKRQKQKLTLKNIKNSVFVGIILESDGILSGLKKLFDRILIPSLMHKNDWGKLSRDVKSSNREIDSFISNIEKFSSTLDDAHTALLDIVKLTNPKKTYSIENKSRSYQRAASKPEIVSIYTECMVEWIEQIDKILNEKRKKIDSGLGPRSELKFWKIRMAKFNSLTDQLKTRKCKKVSGVLKFASSGSKMMERWKKIEIKIEDAASEARDNVKYLKILEKFCEPLYGNDFSQIMTSIPALINTIKMIHGIARYYNTSERMTSLFIKITNQMIKSCKKYILSEGELFNQNIPLLIKKFKSCIDLNEAYKHYYKVVRGELRKNPYGKQFDFSEKSIFGNFDKFSWRIQKLINVFTTIKQFDDLSKSKIDGVDGIVEKFREILQGLKLSKRMDFLDQTKDDFDREHLKFNSKITSLEIDLVTLINNSFSVTTGTHHSLKILDKFKSVLTQESLKKLLDEKYKLIFNNYGRDIETVKQYYEKNKQQPIIERNTSIVAGNIAWAKQLFRIIDEPMKVFKKKIHTMGFSSDLKRIVNQYNKLSIALQCFQDLWFDEWKKSVKNIKDGLQATLLVKHPNTGKLFVNFDTNVLHVIKEIKYLMKMEYTISEELIDLYNQRDNLQGKRAKLQFMLEEYERIIQLQNPLLKNVMAPTYKNVTKELEIGLFSLTWQSLNVDKYVTKVLEKLKEFEQIIHKSNDILNFRLLKNCKYVESILLLDFKDDIMNVKEFVKYQEEVSTKRSNEMNVKNMEVKMATDELIHIVTQKYNSTEKSQISQDVIKLKGFFEKKIFDSIEKSVLNSITLLKEMVIPKSELAQLKKGDPNETKQIFIKEGIGNKMFLLSYFESDSILDIKEKIYLQEYVDVNEMHLIFNSRELENNLMIKDLKLQKDDVLYMYVSNEEKVGKKPKPLFSVNVVFYLPHMKIEPSLEEIQKLINKTARLILESTKNVYMWKIKESIYKKIIKKKQNVKEFLRISKSISGLQVKLEYFLNRFDVYSSLWKLNKIERIKIFEGTNPNSFRYHSVINKYYKIEKDIIEIDDSFDIGCLKLNLCPLKKQLAHEACEWKMGYGNSLHNKTKKTVEDILSFIENTKTKIVVNVDDLEHLNTVMGLLEEIREKENDMEFLLRPVEEGYNTLKGFGIEVSKKEIDMAKEVKVEWGKLLVNSRIVMNGLQKVAPKHKSKLVKEVEVFIDESKKFTRDYTFNGPKVKGITPREALRRLKKFQISFEERKRKKEVYQMGENLFGCKVTQYENLDTIEKELEFLDRLYELYIKVIVTLEKYYEIRWSDIEIVMMEKKMTEFKIEYQKMPMGLRKWEAYLELKKKINIFSDSLPLMDKLNAKFIQKRHWGKVGKLCSKVFNPKSPNFKIKDLLEANIIQYTDEIEEIYFSSVKENQIEERLIEIEQQWGSNGVNFALKEYKSRGKLLLAETEELISDLEDNQIVLSGLIGNIYNQFFKQKIHNWMKKLSTTQTILDQWLKVQALWIYLESIFSGGDIAKELPKVADLFYTVDKDWVEIMKSVEKRPNVVDMCFGNRKLLKTLPDLRERLESCQKSLSKYLEAKKMIFPRFYFVSDNLLLEILGKGSDPNSIQDHLLNIFQNVAKVEFERRKDKKNFIKAMVSAENENVRLSQSVEAVGNVEEWLKKFVSEMKRTIKDICIQMVKKVGILRKTNLSSLQTFIDDFPAQVSLLGLQLFWTAETEYALIHWRERGVMQNCRKRFEKILTNLVTMSRNKNLNDFERRRIETLITIHIKQVDVFNELIQKRIRTTNHFLWNSQTRIYWKREKNKCVISITDVDFDYGYEYYGITDRLVLTKLTDRIYISCAQAMGMYLGGAPAGPAGTGKTETVKDLGATMGKYFITINCSSQMTYISMGKYFKGIAQAGIWCGFDEMNRVRDEVLSVVAAQISCLFDAKRLQSKRFNFVDGTELILLDDPAVFVTMNPVSAEEGYAGRTELPENMKSIFRTIAVVVPNRRTIMKVKLAASGFIDYSILSKKFNVLYSLCEQQLSKQSHYDFGLRNVLSVLRNAGRALRESKDKTVNQSKKELSVLRKVLCDINLAKLVDEDSILFDELMKDLFPEKDVKHKKYGELKKKISEICDEKNLINYPSWNEKMIQFYEQYTVRHGITIMGPSGSGKSKLLRVLAEAITKTQVKTVIKKLNPKAIIVEQIFGKLDSATNDWTDGVLTVLWRDASFKKRDQNTWIVLDGPVETEWVENMNTVLDDTKRLTLANGDRLALPNEIRLIFEVENLENASPATVSRMGMVYLGTTTLPWRPLFESWMKKKSSVFAKKVATKLQNLFLKNIDKIFNFVNHHFEVTVPLNNNSYMSSLLKIFDGLLFGLGEIKITQSLIEKLFIFSVIWSIGGLLTIENRIKFHDFLLKLNFTLPERLTDQDSVFDYVSTVDGKWESWSNRVPEFEFPGDREKTDFSSLFVPTKDSVRSEYLLQLISSQKLPILLVGESGTGKTITLKQFLRKQDKNTSKIKMVAMSSATTPAIFQKTIFSTLVNRMGYIYGPPLNKSLMVFIDDINMPKMNKWENQPTNEIVRQLIEEKGFYSIDRNNLGIWLQIVDLQFYGAMRYGKVDNDIPNRLKRHFNIFNVTFPSRISIDLIFGSISQGFFSAKNGFKSEVVKAIRKIPALTRTIWEKTKETLLPTPKNFWYIFNLRDLSRIFKGMTRITPQVCENMYDLLFLWKHETERVLSDKFVDKEDQVWFRNVMKNELEDEFGDDCSDKIFEKDTFFVDFIREGDVPEGVGETEEEEEEEEEVLLGEVDEPRVYEYLPSFEILQRRLETFLKRFNEKHKKEKMNLVIFEFAMKHVVKISRILKLEGENLLLLGVGGSGKKSLVKLASYVAGYTTFQLNIHKNYTISNLFDDLKEMYRIAALKLPVVFIFGDQDVIEERFLEYINTILTVGEIEGLFSKDDLDQILGELQQKAVSVNPNMTDLSPEQLYKFMIDTAKKNIHLVLCFSPIGETLRNRVNKFPGIISGCTISWFSVWPMQALLATAKESLSDLKIQSSEEHKVELVNILCETHLFMVDLTQEYFDKFRRGSYVTPTSYLNFINNYKHFYEKKMKEINESIAKITKGLKTLEDTRAGVSKLEEKMKIKEQQLQIAVAESDKLFRTCLEQKKIAENARNQILKRRDALTKQKEEIEADKEIIENQLKEARPAFIRAQEAVSQIQTRDIAITKKLNDPPYLIKRVMDTVLIILGLPINPIMIDPKFKKQHNRQIPLASWKLAQKSMGDVNFVKNIIKFDANSLTDETVELLKPYLREKDFTYENVYKVSNSVAALCKWVRCMVEYHEIAKKVAPLQQKVNDAEARLYAKLKELERAEEELKKKEMIVKGTQEGLDNAQKKKQRLEDDARKTRLKIDSAESLIQGLSGEKSRWTEDVRYLNDDLELLIGDVVLSSAFLSYVGPFNQEFRGKIMDYVFKNLREKNIPFSHDFNIKDFLSKPTELEKWIIEGLPKSEHSYQNGIIILKNPKFPIIIDPQLQGKFWIKNKFKEEGKNLVVTQFSEKGFITTLTNCLASGDSLLIESDDTDIDPILDPILQQNVIKKGLNLKIKFGDEECTYNPNFRLFITTKNPNPTYSPEIYAKATVVDFSVTKSGLEDQLLSIVIIKEMVELENKRNKLILEIQKCKEVKEIEEEKLLTKLSHSKKNLLDDVDLIKQLERSKNLSKEMETKMKNAIETEKGLIQAREKYRPVAIRGSTLYFVISELRSISFMYQLGLKFFIRLFVNSIDNASAAKNIHKRISNIITNCTYEIYKFIQRGLFEEDKKVYSLLLALKIDLDEGRISHKDFDCLIRGGSSLSIKDIPRKPCSWITKESWLNLNSLVKIPVFKSLIHYIDGNKNGWKKFYDAKKPEKVRQIPDKYELSAFYKLLLIKSLRIDRTIACSTYYIKSALGQKFVKPIPLNLFECWKENSNTLTPLICLLSLGSDLTSSIESLGESNDIVVSKISMGEGQEKKASVLVNVALKNGSWIILQNCHLGLKYLSKLEGILNDMALGKREYNKRCRIWITTKPTKNFPIGLLHQSIKITDDPPSGVKANLLKSYNWITQGLIDKVDNPEWRKIVYVTSFLHSILIERKKFGALGWSIPYDFALSDLECSLKFLQRHLYEIEPKRIQWNTVKYMISAVQYGGRITDAYDKRIIHGYTERFFGNQIFLETFRFYKSNAYLLPNEDKLEQFKRFIEVNLPGVDNPELFGLHGNAEISLNSNNARKVLGTIMEIQPKENVETSREGSGGGSGGGNETGKTVGKTREAVVRQIAKEYLVKVPIDFGTIQPSGGGGGGGVQKKESRSGKRSKLNDPLRIFLKQEIDIMKKLVKLVRTTFINLDLAITGTLVMTEELQEAMNCLYIGKVPKNWKKYFSDSTFAYWFHSFLRRIDQYKKWLYHGPPRVFWISGFFNQNAFLTAIKQAAKRQPEHTGWSLESVSLKTVPLKVYYKPDVSLPKNQDGCFVYGLYLEGATWSRSHNKLVDSNPKVLYHPLPIIHIIPVGNERNEATKTDYMCPVYKSKRRGVKNFIFNIYLNTDVSESHWALRGVSALTQTT